MESYHRVSVLVKVQKILNIHEIPPSFTWICLYELKRNYSLLYLHVLDLLDKMEKKERTKIIRIQFCIHFQQQVIV